MISTRCSSIDDDDDDTNDDTNEEHVADMVVNNVGENNIENIEKFDAASL